MGYGASLNADSNDDRGSRIGPLWSKAMTASRHAPRTLRRRELPTSPGVYVWFRDGNPVYAGRAKGVKGLQDRLAKHLAVNGDLSRSTFRASVASSLFQLDRKVTRARPTKMTQEQIAAINDWISGCEVAWIEFDTVEDTVAFEDQLLQEWRPPLNIR